MGEKNLGLLEAIDIAMEAEQKANKFYSDAKEKVHNERGKDLLQQLADFEQTHYDKLNELKKSLTEKDEFIEYEGTSFKSKTGSEISGKVEENTDDVLDILSMAIEAEEKAREHYLIMVDQTSDPRGKEMFEKLADEETLHRRILSDEFYQISNKGGMWLWGE